MVRTHTSQRLSRCIQLVLRCAAMALLVDANGIAYAGETFSLSSTTLHDGGRVNTAQVYNEEGCSGGNRSPQLTWRNAPAGTRSFAVTMFDPDAPGPGWWHWAVADIPASVTTLPENASASGALKSLGAIEGRNDFGNDGYGGPCPPSGKTHRYVVTVFALRTDRIGLVQGRPAPMFDHEISDSTLGSAQITVNYGR